MRSPLLSLVRGWRAALLLVVVACASPQRAAAECGDYVTILNAPAGSTRHAMPSPADTGETRAPARPPCHGPNCQGAPDRHVPPPAPVAPAGPQGKELAQHLDVVDAVEAPPATFDRDTSSPRPVRRASSVFHPPRLG